MVNQAIGSGNLQISGSIHHVVPVDRAIPDHVTGASHVDNLRRAGEAGVTLYHRIPTSTLDRDIRRRDREHRMERQNAGGDTYRGVASTTGRGHSRGHTRLDIVRAVPDAVTECRGVIPCGCSC